MALLQIIFGGWGPRSLGRQPKTYRAETKYPEDCTFIVILEMLERLPGLKPRVKQYLEAFPS